MGLKRGESAKPQYMDRLNEVAADAAAKFVAAIEDQTLQAADFKQIMKFSGHAEHDS